MFSSFLLYSTCTLYNYLGNLIGQLPYAIVQCSCTCKCTCTCIYLIFFKEQTELKTEEPSELKKSNSVLLATPPPPKSPTKEDPGFIYEEESVVSSKWEITVSTYCTCTFTVCQF